MDATRAGLASGGERVAIVAGAQNSTPPTPAQCASDELVLVPTGRCVGVGVLVRLMDLLTEREKEAEEAAR